MPGRRIFIAIDISDSAREVCAAHLDHLRKEFPQVRVGWELAEKLHLTLKFLGDTDPHVLEELQLRIPEIGLSHKPFKLRLSKPGVFPLQRRPRILWIGLDDPTDIVSRIQREVEALCGDLGFERDTKVFRPHITIARIREPKGSVGLAEAHLKETIEPVEFEVTEIVIYESKLLSTGSKYSVVSAAAKLRPFI